MLKGFICGRGPRLKRSVCGSLLDCEASCSGHVLARIMWKMVFVVRQIRKQPENK